MAGQPDDAYLELLGAIDQADLARIARLLEEGAPLAAPDGRRTALHYAIDHGTLEVLDFLIARGADLEARDRNDLTPLMSACIRGGEAATRAARHLIAASADVRAVRRADWLTPLGAAVGPGFFPLRLIEQLIDRGAEVHGPEGNDWPPLMDAVKSNHLEAMKLLLALGARPDARCRDATVVEVAESYDCMHAPLLRAALARRPPPS